MIALDFETRSNINLKLCGTDVYASDPSTDILMCSFINKDNGQEWLWYAGTEAPADLCLALQSAVEIEAHNARFDQLIYEYIAIDYGFPLIPKEKWVCTAAACRVNALPANLDGATRAANAKHKKDHSGAALIRQLCIPDRDGNFNSDPALMRKMGNYCLKDSRAMVSLTQQLRPLSEADKRDWQINERINDRGIMIDRDLAALAEDYADMEKYELGQKLKKLTDGYITKVTQTKRLLERFKVLFADDREFMACITKEDKFTLDKAARSQLLELDLDPHYREVIQLIDNGGNSSVAKFTSMLNRADPETGRVHGAFIFAGAGQTQRYSSKGLQLHNMRRDCYDAETTEMLKGYMEEDEQIDGMMNENMLDVLAKLLRPAIIPAPGHKFVVGDWSAIEARVLPWLADSMGGEGVLNVFWNREDIYMTTAATLGIDDRQIGKVANLSLGYGGALGAFQAMAKNYGLNMPDVQVLGVVRRWRRGNKWAVTFWAELAAATVKAVRVPGTVQYVGRIRYVYVDILGGTLMCVLPNDTVIQYPYARIEKGVVTCMKASVQPKADSDDEWPRMRLWGGFLAENVTQATAACLLRDLLYEMSEYPVVGHCHDEVILEVEDEEVKLVCAELKEYMETCPSWAKGLPLSAEPVVMERYGK